MFEQDRVLARLQQRVMREPSILSCFLIGSYGRRQQDAYSDLDVVLVFQSPSSRDLLFRRRDEFSASILQFVAVKTVDIELEKAYAQRALYANGTAIDFRYEVKSELVPNSFDRDIYVLKDTADWASQFQNAARNAPSQTRMSITVAELSRLDNQFWVLFWETYRLLRRGDVQTPFPVYLELLYRTLPTLMALLPVDDPARSRLIDLLYAPAASQTIEHLKLLLNRYLDARSAVVREYQLHFEADSRFEESLKRLVQK